MAYTVFNGPRSPERPSFTEPNKHFFGTTLMETKQLHVGKCWLSALLVSNKHSSAIYVHLFDAADGATDVTANAVPSYPALLYVAAGQNASLNGGTYGLPFVNGLYIACSTVPEKLTAVGSNVLQFHAQFIV